MHKGCPGVLIRRGWKVSVARLGSLLMEKMGTGVLGWTVREQRGAEMENSGLWF